ncbi:hypothetical protein [uncultured Rubinisphaera sp.]|uniref:hypothetical protein n=1 Tax=uncultured Rubinisphaera sp. TaxID=1678686 RepID=UPI0030DC152C|tara:strand:+ start:28 stop:468 length:441 start_codon:yes stop_codon:yes gene_type:complete
MNPQVTLQTSNEFSPKNASRWSLTLVFLALGLAGSILVFKTAKAAYLVICGQPAQAICYRIDTNSSSHRGHQRKSRQYYVEYQTANGALAKGRIVPGFRKLSIGSKIDVLYSPHISSLVEANNPVSLGIYPVLTLVVIGFLIWFRR